MVARIPRVCPERAEGHNWVLDGVRPDKFEAVYKEGTLYRYCNFCHIQDRETKLCIAMVRTPGRWPRWHTCGAPARTKSDRPFALGELATNLDGTERENGRRKADGQEHWYCGRHDPVREVERARVKDAADRKRFNDDMWKLANGYNGSKVQKLLEQLDEWGKANQDLVESDEWLGVIMRDARGHLRELRRER